MTEQTDSFRPVGLFGSIGNESFMVYQVAARLEEHGDSKKLSEKVILKSKKG